jgi:hypothetical protein
MVAAFRLHSNALGPRAALGQARIAAKLPD